MSGRRGVRVALLAMWAALTAGVLFGCAGTPVVVSLERPTKRYAAEEYREVLELWTRHESVIQLTSLDNTLKVHATFLSPEFSLAYVARKAHVYRFSEADRIALRSELQEEEDKSYSFFVAASTPDPAWNDFERKPSSWRVTLVNDAKEQAAPLTIDAKKKVTPAIKDFYPYVGSFYRVYTIRFPKVLADGRPLVRAETKQLTLRFAGPLGVAELSWRLQ